MSQVHGRSQPSSPSSATEPDWRLVAESFPHVVWVSAADGAVEYVNRRGVRYLGVDAEELYGWGWKSLVYPDGADPVLESWQEASRSGRPFEFDFRLRRADGRFRWQTARGMPIRARDGTVMGWIATLTDVDDQRRFQGQIARAERESAEATALVGRLLQSAPIGFAFLDRGGRITWVNDEMAAACGLRADQGGGREAVDLFGEHVWSQCEPTYRQVLVTGKAVRNVPVVGLPPRNSTQMREWLTGYYPLDTGGRTSGVGLVALDVTDRMRAERLRTAVMSQVTDGVYTEDADGRVTSLNRAASRMLGWTEAELRGRRAHDVFHYQTMEGTPVPATQCMVRAAAETGRLIRAMGKTFTRKDGTVFPVGFTAVPLRRGPDVEGVAVIFRDMSPVPVARGVIRVLLASADERMVEAARALLDTHEGTRVVGVAPTPHEAVAFAQTAHPDVALIDYCLPGRDGIETVCLMRAGAPAVKALLLVDDDDEEEELVLAAVDAGCKGVVSKSRGLVELIAAVDAAHQGGTVMSHDELLGVLASARRQEVPEPARQTIDLTQRERDVLGCISGGLSNRQVAERLGLTVNTVRNHVQRILYKLQAHSKLEAVITAQNEGIVPVDTPRAI